MPFQVTGGKNPPVSGSFVFSCVDALALFFFFFSNPPWGDSYIIQLSWRFVRGVSSIEAPGAGSVAWVAKGNKIIFDFIFLGLKVFSATPHQGELVVTGRILKCKCRIPQKRITARAVASRM